MAKEGKGFFGRMFQRKPGGTRLGNLIRQVAKNNTYGVFGQGAPDQSYGEILFGPK